ncbi:hypothetical protein NMG60_11027373 [Bertholletia excelsa]
MEILINHCSHNHPLEICTKRKEDGVNCDVCAESISGLSYGCDHCSFFIHILCSQLPQRISHPFHPQHPLTLLPSSLSEPKLLICDACGAISLGFTFRCTQCQFDLDVHCAALVPVDEIDTIQHFSHPHPLILCNTKKNRRVSCSCCSLPIEKGLVYVCLECHRFLHKSCCDLPEKIYHPFHPQHPLILHLLRHPYSPRRFQCDACGFELDCSTYHCSKCQFDLDVHCAMLKPTRNSESEEIRAQHFTHPHPLIPCAKIPNFPHPCYACLSPPEETINVCLECPLILHESCADLPREIKHPMSNHPLQPLVLQSPSVLPKEVCGVCSKRATNWKYICGGSRFVIDSACAQLPCFKDPTIWNRQEYLLPLVYFEAGAKHFRCTACALPCDGPCLRCVDYNMNLHVGCIPNPLPSIKHKSHVHPLTLTYSPISDQPEEDGEAEFYCDLCEERSSWVGRSYCCEECCFFVHVGCVMPEVLYLQENCVWAGVSGKLELEMPAVMTEENVDDSVSGLSMFTEERQQEKANLNTDSGAETSNTSVDTKSEGSPTGKDFANRCSQIEDEEVIKLKAELAAHVTKMRELKKDLVVRSTNVEELNMKLQALNEQHAQISHFQLWDLKEKT